MPKLSAVASRTSLFSLGAVVLAVTAVLGLSSTERLMGQSVSAGLVEAQARTPSLPLAGSEAFWLSSHDGASALTTTVQPAGRIFALGDRITISTGSGGERVLEVVELRPISGAILPAASNAAASPRLLLVTCREVGAPAETRSLMRFVIEADPASETHSTPGRDRVL